MLHFQDDLDVSLFQVDESDVEIESDEEFGIEMIKPSAKAVKPQPKPTAVKAAVAAAALPKVMTGVYDLIWIVTCIGLNLESNIAVCDDS